MTPTNLNRQIPRKALVLVLALLHSAPSHSIDMDYENKLVKIYPEEINIIASWGRSNVPCAMNSMYSSHGTYTLNGGGARLNAFGTYDGPFTDLSKNYELTSNIARASHTNNPIDSYMGNTRPVEGNYFTLIVAINAQDPATHRDICVYYQNKGLKVHATAVNPGPTEPCVASIEPIHFGTINSVGTPASNLPEPRSSQIVMTCPTSYSVTINVGDVHDEFQDPASGARIKFKYQYFPSEPCNGTCIYPITATMTRKPSRPGRYNWSVPALITFD